ncbi:MAG: hypothetical protein MSK40_04280 [Parabacteroides sp.]|nr:hypothetical protein [Parabacteroides sp.]
MKKLTNRLISFILTLSILCSISVTAFAAGPAQKIVIDGLGSYTVVSSVQTEYGPMYFVKEDGRPQTRTFWDILDVAMAGKSWSDMLEEPSWGNFAWALLDTAALLPLIPSTAYVREGGKVLLKADDFLKFAKTSKGKKAIEGAMKVFKYSDGITEGVRKQIRKGFPKKEAEMIIEAFEKAANKGLTGSQGQTGIKKLTGKIDKIYTHEIKILGKYGGCRIYGYKDGAKWVFDKFVKSH